MRTIGLTGGIACGKSNVSSELRRLGAFVIDGDVISRELTAPGGAALPAIREAFGGSVFAAPDVLDRKALGALIFSDGAARERLDAVMQPLILREILRRMDEARAKGEALCVLDMPLLYEKGLAAGAADGTGRHRPRGRAGPRAEPDGRARKGPPRGRGD